MEVVTTIGVEAWRALGSINLAGALTTAILILTALAAVSQARSVAQGNIATFFVNYSARYSSEEMADALRLLAAWHNANKADKKRFETWAAQKRQGADQALALNKARRMVSRFYYDVAELYALGLIKRRMAKRLIANNGLNVFYLVCDPMNRAYEPSDRFDSYCRTLRRLSGGFGNGNVFDPDEIGAAALGAIA